MIADGRLKDAAENLAVNGGRITDDVDDPALTHIIMDDDDSGRYVQIMRRTSKYVVPLWSGGAWSGADPRPKHKHIVLPSWVTESLDEETLMDEDCECP